MPDTSNPSPTFILSIKPRGALPRFLGPVPARLTEAEARHWLLSIWHRRLAYGDSTESIGLLDANQNLLAVFDGEWNNDRSPA